MLYYYICIVCVLYCIALYCLVFVFVFLLYYIYIYTINYIYMLYCIISFIYTSMDTCFVYFFVGMAM